MFKTTATSRFHEVFQSLLEKSGWQRGKPLFLYMKLMIQFCIPINPPSKSFSTEGFLIVNCSTMPARGRASLSSTNTINRDVVLGPFPTFSIKIYRSFHKARKKSQASLLQQVLSRMHPRISCQSLPTSSLNPVMKSQEPGIIAPSLSRIFVSISPSDRPPTLFPLLFSFLDGSFPPMKLFNLTSG